MGEQALELWADFELESVKARSGSDSVPRPVMVGGLHGVDGLVEGLNYATALLDPLAAIPVGVSSWAV